MIHFKTWLESNKTSLFNTFMDEKHFQTKSFIEYVNMKFKNYLNLLK
jgi:hypothetical protein